MSVAKKELFKAIKAGTAPGEHRNAAFKQAGALGIKKNATGKITDLEAQKLLKGLQKEHLLHSYVGENRMSTSGKTGKQLEDGMLGEKKAEKSFSEIKAERAAEKKAAMERISARRAEIDANRAATIQAATAKSYIHERAAEAQKEEEQGKWEHHQVGIGDHREGSVSALEPADPAKAIDLPVD